ncbi:MBL fold metallo-hydrolase [Cryptosporangium aurantiacum]|uniref:Ribonuclease BN, tRNA processing enzyme n=1 Tax=Cryptosporangium aurantiacum TaxID=134849 RepID=A0A1M7QE44_9ACTN|nr:MBL fold metallo-hydrolase [Cryptosporangium aurantiacum]SHN29163.1 Ribonuclease BN, tRNA processing enzyme [Cryptosporangium aurantiacum]
MKLSVLGCAGSFPGPDSPCSSYLLEAEGFRLLLDFGTGALGALQRHPAGMHGVDAIVLSHLHCDHILDACSYVVVRRYDPAGKHRPMPLYGPAGTGERLAQIYGPEDYVGGSVEDVYDVKTLQPGRFAVGPFAIVAARVNHPVETFGVRIEHGDSAIAYSADTGRSEALVDLARDVDLFLCEASYLEDKPHPPDLHLTGLEAGEYATRAQAGRLVLTHLVQAWGDPEKTLAEARSAYAGPIDLAYAGAEYQI